MWGMRPFAVSRFELIATMSRRSKTWKVSRLIRPQRRISQRMKHYIVNGKMTGGFAVIASPVKYGDSGVMTFIINRDGVVYQRDLGPDPQKVLMSCTRASIDIWNRLSAQCICPQTRDN
jgi:hypothetical protein